MHPWQRALEASKRAIRSRTEEHEAALLREKRCRSDARRAAAVSKDCQKARKRVAARLGRHKQRRSRLRRSVKNGDHAERDTEQPRHLGFGRENTQFNTEGHGEDSRDNLDGDGYPCRETPQQQPGDYDGGSDGHDDYLHQMRDALGWARKTLTALVQRLKDRGVAIDNLAAAAARAPVGPRGGERTAKDWEVVLVVNKLRRRLAAFEDEGVTFGVERGAAAAAEGLAAAGTNSTSSLLRSRCEAACESFEIEFGHMIDELTATARTHPSNPNLQLSHFACDTDGGSSTLTAAGPEDEQQQASSSGGVRRSANPRFTASAAARSKKPVGTASFGLCPSCSVLPVARRCLDCEGNHADRDRCSSCFVSEHREAPRHLHRFLRISGGSGISGAGGDESGDGGGYVEPEQHLGAQRGDNTRAGNSGMQGNSSGVDVRCSRCGDLAAARRCRECRVDTCAACHFLTHRSPSRRSHVTAFVGETAVALQETLHSRNRHQSVAATRTAASRATRNGDGGEESASGEGDGAGEGIVGPAKFGEDAALSLAQVRRTIDAPVVRPRSQASKELGSLSCGRDGGDGGSVECSEEEDLCDEVDGGGSGYEGGRSHRNGRGGDRDAGQVGGIYDGKKVGIRNRAGTFVSGGRIGADAAGNNGGGSVRDDQKGKEEHADESSGATEGTVRGERDATATKVFDGSVEDDDDSGRFEGRGGHRDAGHHQGGRGLDGDKYALGVLEEINEEGEGEEGEDDEEGESTGSSIYSSSEEDTEDEGMVRNSFLKGQTLVLVPSGIFAT